MDVQEVRKLDGYLKKLFGNTQIRVVPKGSDTAEIFVGEDKISASSRSTMRTGKCSYNFRMVIQVTTIPAFSRCRRSTPISAGKSI